MYVLLSGLRFCATAAQLDTRKIKKIERKHRIRCLKEPTQKNRIRRYISSSILKGSGINGQETRYQY